MTPKEKAATGLGSRAASNKTNRFEYYSTRSRIKSAIVRLALWGLLTVKLAEWIIRRVQVGAES